MFNTYQQFPRAIKNNINILKLMVKINPKTLHYIPIKKIMKY